MYLLFFCYYASLHSTIYSRILGNKLYKNNINKDRNAVLSVTNTERKGIGRQYVGVGVCSFWGKRGGRRKRGRKCVCVCVCVCVFVRRYMCLCACICLRVVLVVRVYREKKKGKKNSSENNSIPIIIGSPVAPH